MPHPTSPTATTSTVSPPPSYSRSIQKLLRSVNNERDIDYKNKLKKTKSSLSNEFEQSPSTDQYYTTFREGKRDSYADTNGNNARQYKDQSFDECNEWAENSREIGGKRCFEKYESDEQELRTNNQEASNGLSMYRNVIMKRDGDDDTVSLSSFRQKVEGGKPVVSIRSTVETREGRSAGREGGEQQIDLSEPAIFIATRGPTYDQYRLRRPTIRLIHKSEGKRQQVSVDLDGGQKINKSTIENQDTMIRGNKTRSEINNNNNPTSIEKSHTTKDTFECNKRQYTFKAVKRDDLGNKCSGIIKATICYGSCDTGEIADWIFPFKKSIHKVCSHGQRVRRRVILPECTSNLDPSLREYHYVDARTCVCRKCDPAETTCLGSLTRPYLMSGGEFGSGSGNSGGGLDIERTISEAELIF